MSLTKRAAILSAFLLASAILASAGTLGLTSPVGTLLTAGDPQLWGWIFSVDSPITVNALGVYDIGSDGLQLSHDVGIFRQSDHSLLASATVPAGTLGTLDGGFRFVTVSPFLLPLGNYVIVMTMQTQTTDRNVALATSFSTASQITYVSSVIDSGSALAFPNPLNNGLFGPGLFGPNFVIDAGVPEPASCGLLALGLGALAAFVRRRR